MEELYWVFNLKKKVPFFLDKMKGNKRKGFYRYSLSGDLYSEDKNWGLGNTVFAAKIFYTLNMIDSLPRNEISDMVDFIKSFQKSDGGIYDPLISRKVSMLNRLLTIVNLEFPNFWGHMTKRAEARQSFSTLKLLKSKPDLPYMKIPYTYKAIDKYLKKLNWSKPYGAGSHFSHLLFFLHANKDMFGVYKESADELIDYAIDWVNKFQSCVDGSWYQGESIVRTQKINGAMKVITGLQAVGKMNFEYPDKLIDLCLSVNNLAQACNTLDVIYVIHHANKLTNGNHRYNDIRDFCYRWLDTCREHYFKDIGGFSFFKHKANQYYYGAKITKGLNEPDIHGTVLLLWGITLIAKILGINKKLDFKELVS